MENAPTFRRRKQIRFHHCDPAGIVFYPQYFVLLHEFIEDWFNEGLEISYADMLQVQRLGIPTVRLECDFRSPSRLGDIVTLSLQLTRLGNSSLGLELAVVGNGEGEDVRLTVAQTVVLMSLDTGRPRKLPDDYRRRMSRHAGDNAAVSAAP